MTASPSVNAAHIDLAQRAFVHRRAEIVAIGTWLHVDGQVRPCMALIRHGEEWSDLTRPFIVTGDTAWRWDETIGDAAFSARQCFIACQCLRLTPDQRNIFKIATLVHDLLGDLISIPPFPPSGAPKTVVAEVTITNRHTGETREVELTDV